MGLTRVLIIAAGVWLVIVLLRRQHRRRPPARQEARLVRCAQCGVYLPEHETRVREDQARICAHH